MDERRTAPRRVAEALRDGHAAKELRRKGWDRPTHGVIRPTLGVDPDPVRDRVEIASALMSRQCVLGGWAALWWQGNSWFDGRDRDGTLRRVLIHCEPGSRLRRRREVEPFRGLLHPDEWSRYEGFAVASLARAAFDEMRVASSLTEAVVVADMAISTVHGRPHTSRSAIDAVLDSHHKVRGIVRARDALALASPRAASPWETRTRMLARMDAGLTGLAVNVPIFDLREGLLGIADLLDPDSGLVIESDGAHHREAQAHAEDNRREERFERAGLTVVRVSAVDHARRWDVVRRLNEAHRDALASPVHRWTIDEPAWWSSSSLAHPWGTR